MDLVIIFGLIILTTLVLYLIYTVKQNLSGIVDSKNNVNVSKLDLQNGLNQLLIQTVEKNSEHFTKTLSAINESSNNSTLNLKDNFSSLKEELLTKNWDNAQKLQLSISDALNKSTIQLLSQSKLELDKIQNSNKESINGLIVLSKNKLEEINVDVQKRLDENFARSLKSFEDITKNLGQIEQKAQTMIESTKSIDKLNSIFSRTSSKAFGGFAESYLESILSDHLDPESWKKQVSFEGSSEKLDFVIYFGDKVVGIDSKFPLTKFNDYLEEQDFILKENKRTEYIKTVKEMAKSISEKYLKTNHIQTLLLYLPSDSMYLECLHEGDKLLNTLQKLKVTLISPNTLFPQILILQNYQNQITISANASNIINGLSKIKKNLLSFKDQYDKLGQKLNQAQSNYDSASKSLDGVSKNIASLQSSEDGSNVNVIEFEEQTSL